MTSFVNDSSTEQLPQSTFPRVSGVNPGPVNGLEVRLKELVAGVSRSWTYSEWFKGGIRNRSQSLVVVTYSTSSHQRRRISNEWPCSCCSVVVKDFTSRILDPE